MFSTVSESLSLKLTSRYPTKKVSVITNGFDPEFVNESATLLTKEFTITYTGLTYQTKQDPAKLFNALNLLISEGLIDSTKIKIRFYGVVQKWISQLAKLFNVEYMVFQYGPILHDDTIQRQRESQLLLMFGWEDEYETGVLPTKMFEYFAARRPILATGGTMKEQFRSIFDSANVGYCAIDVNDIKRILYDYYCDYMSNGFVKYHGIPQELDKYNYREMAKKFSNALDEVTKK